ncbi:hypothetical protein ACO0K3_03785 [Undibacterium sp. Rencai35W]|uniref:hypothetical protein n=1 Tax=Undibacterium sp. Rencai35W TaxID=3413046 RepID=UPI003BF04289
MARARNIKPGMYKNEDLAECSIWARYIFPGMWMLADREGRLEDRPKRIKGELLAYDTVEVEPLLAELEKFGFIVRYEAEGQRFIQIVKFSEHQAPHVREQASTIPAPSNSTQEQDKEVIKHDLGSDMSSPRLPDSLIPSSLIPDCLIPETTAPQAASTKAPKFDFAKELELNGVASKVVAAWMAVRKAKRATNTDIALESFVREAGKAGLSVPDAVLICVERSWSGINADWLKPKQQGSPRQSINDDSQLGIHGQATANAAKKWLESKNAG